MGKLQITLLKFGVDWISHSKISKTWFYTQKFVPFAIHPPQLISAVKWHINIILMPFFFFLAKSTPKLRHFSDEQVKSWHASKLCSFKPKLKIKTSSLNDIVLGQILKSNYKDHEELTSLTQTPWTQTPWFRLN